MPLRLQCTGGSSIEHLNKNSRRELSTADWGKLEIVLYTLFVLPRPTNLTGLYRTVSTFVPCFSIRLCVLSYPKCPLVNIFVCFLSLRLFVDSRFSLTCKVSGLPLLQAGKSSLSRKNINLEKMQYSKYLKHNDE